MKLRYSANIAVMLLLAVATFGFASPAHAVIRLGTANTTSLSQGLVGYWPLDGAVTSWATGQTRDLSGNGNTGTLVNMSTTSSPKAGKIGQALNFNGNGQCVHLGTTGGYTDKVTVSAWFSH